MADGPQQPIQPSGYASLVTVLSQLVQGQGRIVQTLAGLQPNLSPVYATGTWTPTLEFGGSATGITYSAQAGTYTQVGREITCRFTITLTSKGSQTGAATIGGLPFTGSANATMAGTGGICPIYSGMASLTGVPVVAVAASATAASLQSSGAAASAALTNANFGNSTVLSGQFQYFTD